MSKILLILVTLFLTISASFAQTPTPTQKKTIGGVVNGKAISLVKPPSVQKISGEVRVEVLIDEQGNIFSAKAVSGSTDLYQMSEKAALASKFSPTILSGKPVKVSGVIVYKFKTTDNLKEKLKFLNLGAFLSMAKIILPDEWGEPLSKNEFTNEVVMREMLLPITKITKQTSMENRLQILNQVQASLEKKLSGDDTWQYELGRELGGLMTEIHKIISDDTAKLNEIAVKNHLLKIRTMLSSTPADFPMEVSDKFKQIINLGDNANIKLDEITDELAQLILEMLDMISSN